MRLFDATKVFFDKNLRQQLVCWPLNSCIKQHISGKMTTFLFSKSLIFAILFNERFDVLKFPRRVIIGAVESGHKYGDLKVSCPNGDTVL